MFCVVLIDMLASSSESKTRTSASLRAVPRNRDLITVGIASLNYNIFRHTGFQYFMRRVVEFVAIPGKNVLEHDDSKINHGVVTGDSNAVMWIVIRLGQNFTLESNSLGDMFELAREQWAIVLHRDNDFVTNFDLCVCHVKLQNTTAR
jgi:hypothetical protein